MKKIRPFNNIFLRVYGSFAILVLFFALLLGIIFIRLYTDSNKQNTLDQLTGEAKAIAAYYRTCIYDEEYENALSYLSVVNEIQTAEVWTVSNPFAETPMNTSIENMPYEKLEDNVPFQLKTMVDVAFSGETSSDSFYSEMHGATILSVCMPLTGRTKEICGALMLISNMEAMDDTISSTRSMIVLSATIALLISFAVATALAKMITGPISQMKSMTREMMEGNYHVKTGIDRTDEIGEMARSIDMLSEKLLENEEERKYMDQMRLDFFANVSHELRTPISVVRAYTESLVDGVVSDEEQVAKYYERILNECKSMQRLVGDLLTLSKMQNPSFQIEKEPVNIVHIIDELVRNAMAISAGKNISVQVRRDSEVCMIMGDYDRLRQMFMVIFDNAIKFSPPGSTIHVTVKRGDRLTISIRDEGIGISEEELPNIFEKFYKSKLRQNAKGTGLGLAIAKYVALKHDGTIEVKSKLGEGTEFIFSFTEVHESDFT